MGRERTGAGFIGAGKVGCSLGKLFQKSKLPVTGYVSKSRASAVSAAGMTGSNAFAGMKELVVASNILFLTVPDGCIVEVWQELRKIPLAGKIVCHCSGSLPAAILNHADEVCIGACSLHPLYAVSSCEEGWRGLSSAVFTLEGSAAAVEELRNWLHPAGIRLQLLEGIDKALYHAAAVFASNLVIGLAQEACTILEDCGFDQNTARQALAPLLAGNMKRLVEEGAEKALTGPMERNDVQTVERHLDVLDGDRRELYRLLSLRLLDVATRKHPDRNMEPMLALLKNKLQA